MLSQKVAFTGIHLQETRQVIQKLSLLRAEKPNFGNLIFRRSKSHQIGLNDSVDYLYSKTSFSAKRQFLQSNAICSTSHHHVMRCRALMEEISACRGVFFFSKLLQANCVKRELKIICTLKRKLILGRRKDVGSCLKCPGLFSFLLPLQILAGLTVCVCLLSKRMSRIHKSAL